MRVIGINGSPRKTWNTATLLEKALEGAASVGAETELIHIYDLDYKGCRSCFACKLKTGASYGSCAVKDELQPVLARVQQADALVLGSPIYYGMVTGEMRSFLERLLFPYLVYDKDYSSLRKKDTPTGMIYTMNATEAGAADRNYPQTLGALEAAIQRTFSGTAIPALYATDTLQVEDYPKYGITGFDGQHKKQRREVDFPKDCQRAFDLGARLCGPATA
jgi:multimeric flavodoxin WrbA